MLDQLKILKRKASRHSRLCRMKPCWKPGAWRTWGAVRG